MVCTRKQKLAAVAAMHPFSYTGILKHIFAFLPGQYLFLDAVCREWKALYMGIQDQRVHCIHVDGGWDHWQVYDSQTTWYSAAVASPATVRLARWGGLRRSKNLQLHAGLYASIEALTLLLELDVPLSEELVKAAALSGRLHVLQHLLSLQQCPRPIEMSHYAARSCNISMLNWLRAEGWCVFDCETCAGAAEGGQLLALQYLRNEGCDWEYDCIAGHAASSGSIEVIEWLRQQQGIEMNAETLAWAVGAGQMLCASIWAD
jgi:hypothetical protein